MTAPPRRPPAPGLAERVADLGRRLDRLTVHRRDPERFFEERSELTEELRRLAAEMRERVR